MSQGPRHTAREYALRMFYGADLLQQAGDGRPLRCVPNWWGEEGRLHVPPQAEKFAYELFKTFRQNQESIDMHIQNHSHNWRLSRMSPVDRNILRLAVSELMLKGESPNQVILNEAIELAKCYGDEKSPRFVNGILDALMKDFGQEVE